MSIQVWRRATKCVAFFDIIFSASILLTIIALAAVEVAEKKIEARQQANAKERNATATNQDDEKPKHASFWKIWAGSMTLFLLTALQIWSSGRLYKGASSVQPMESIRRTAVVWIIIKILLAMVGIPIKVVIFHAYIVAAITFVTHVLLILVVAKFVKELKVVIKAG